MPTSGVSLSTAGKRLGFFSHGGAGAIPAVAGAYDRDALWIDVRLVREVLGRFAEVERLVFAEMLVHDFHERAAVVICPAVVDADDDVALLRQPLRPATG